MNQQQQLEKKIRKLQSNADKLRNQLKKERKEFLVEKNNYLSDLRKIVVDEDLNTTIQYKMKFKLEDDIEKCIWMGDL